VGSVLPNLLCVLCYSAPYADRRGKHVLVYRTTQVPAIRIPCIRALSSSSFPSSPQSCPFAIQFSSFFFEGSTYRCPLEGTYSIHSTLHHASILMHHFDPLRIDELALGAVNPILPRKSNTNSCLPGRHWCHRSLLQRPASGDPSRDSIHLHTRHCRNLDASRSHMGHSVLRKLFTSLLTLYSPSRGSLPSYGDLLCGQEQLRQQSLGHHRCHGKETPAVSGGSAKLSVSFLHASGSPLGSLEFGSGIYYQNTFC
jgi:hypothetical protein